MLEDELLKLRFKRGNTKALAGIYDKYADYLLSIALALLNDRGLAEDVLHDVFVRFAGSVTSFRIRGSLKAYLVKCVINRSRDHLRTRGRKPVSLDEARELESDSAGPESTLLKQEQSARLTDALGQLRCEQREVVVLKVKGGMKFRQIAALQGISVSAAQARYRYGIDKLRSILNNEKRK